jgi:sulfite reductase (NADPH) flavoprotein alpha-component
LDVLANEGGSTAVAPKPDLAGQPTVAPATAPASKEEVASKWTKTNPYAGALVRSDSLSGPGSAKDVRHVVFELSDPAMRYEPGDALGVYPRNDPLLVEELLQFLRATGEENLAWGGGVSGTLRDALLTHFEITRIPAALLDYFARVSGDAELGRVISPEANGDRSRYLFGREIIDLFIAFPSVQPTPAEFLGMLRKLQPRLYSIASSPRLHPGEVHLTVGTVRYESLGRRRHGVCSTYLADRVPIGAKVPLFIHENPSFRPPDDATDLIMVGPGTGIAPFRAFLEDRAARGATGRNWLFFGDQRESTDFLYRAELETFRSRGVLHRLDLAWSREQGHKVYVQDRMREHSAEVWSWLERGAAFYVCGDASRMAKDVDVALHEVIQRAGGKSAEHAAAYVRELKSTKRYRRDVY